MTTKSKTMELTFTRTIPASPAEIFGAWMDPKHPGNPWASATKLILDARVDGLFYFSSFPTTTTAACTTTAGTAASASSSSSSPRAERREPPRVFFGARRLTSRGRGWSYGSWMLGRTNLQEAR